MISGTIKIVYSLKINLGRKTILEEKKKMQNDFHRKCLEELMSNGNGKETLLQQFEQHWKEKEEAERNSTRVRIKFRKTEHGEDEIVWWTILKTESIGTQ